MNNIRLQLYPMKSKSSKKHSSSSSAPKVALLFLTNADHEQELLWKSFLTKHKHQYSVYCHPAKANTISPHSILRRTSSQSKYEGLLPRYKCIPKPNNRWGHLVLAYYQLLHQAYHDPANNNQRFVYLSETCVPCASADDVYKRMTAHLNVTYMDAPHSQDDLHRYNALVPFKSWINMFPMSKKQQQKQKKTRRNQPDSCAAYFKQSGILKSHFFKHAGWFSPNRDAAGKLLRHKDAFQALNMTQAGDEHILSILKRDIYTSNTPLTNQQVTYVTWNESQKQEWEKIKTNELKDSKFWNKMDKKKLSDPEGHAEYLKKREECKNASMHPVMYTKLVPKKTLNECHQLKSCFIRKVRASCNVQPFFDIIQSKSE